MTDPYAEVRAKVQQAAADVAAFAMERYRPRIEFAQQNGAHDQAAQLAHQMQVDITRLTDPLAKLLARLPPPPVIVTMDGDRIVRIDHG